MFYKTVGLETVLEWLVGDGQAADSKLLKTQTEGFCCPKKKSQTPGPDPLPVFRTSPCFFYSSLSLASGPAGLPLSLSDAFSLSIPRVFDSVLHLAYDACPVRYTAVLITPILTQILAPRTHHCLLSPK